MTMKMEVKAYEWGGEESRQGSVICDKKTRFTR